MTAQAASSGRVPAWPVAILVIAMAGFQSGGSLAKTLFPAVGAAGATALRLAIAAAILMALARPWRTVSLRRENVTLLLVYGLAMAGLNAFFFQALKTIPIGVAVAIDFLGPLGVAVGHSRRPVDIVWACLAGVGVAILLPWAGNDTALDPVGLVYCLCAACCWAGYILAGRRAGLLLSDADATALGMTVAAVAVLPFGIAEAGSSLISGAVLPTALVVAILSSAIPYRLEMMALTRLPTRVFGVLMSLEPALGALFGWLILDERLSARQGAAILLIIVASAGATWTAHRRGAATAPA